MTQTPDEPNNAPALNGSGSSAEGDAQRAEAARIAAEAERHTAEAEAQRQSDELGNAASAERKALEAAATAQAEAERKAVELHAEAERHADDARIEAERVASEARAEVQRHTAEAERVDIDRQAAPGRAEVKQHGTAPVSAETEFAQAESQNAATARADAPLAQGASSRSDAPAGYRRSATATDTSPTLEERRREIAAAASIAASRAAETVGPAAQQVIAFIGPYMPIAAIAGASFLGASALNAGPELNFMHGFMGLFLFGFAILKLVDVEGFATLFRKYDVVAKRWPIWALAFPLVELLLGALYLGGGGTLTYLLTIAVMGVSAYGILRALQRGEAFVCACTGSAAKVPLGKVSLVETAGMAGMAALMMLVP